jgi:hypothetical protein
MYIDEMSGPQTNTVFHPRVFLWFLLVYYISLKWPLSCVVLCCVVRYSRPNGWADRAEHWHKHSLELCDEDMGLSDRECELMRALRAQTCAQYHISSIGGQTAGPVEFQIGTNTHWDNGQNVWGSAIASAH